MTTPSSRNVPRFDFDALYRGDSPAEGVPAMSSPPWDTKAPKESVVGWQAAGLVRGDVLDIGCGLGDNAIYLARNGHRVTGLDISPTALATAERRAAAAGVDVTFAVADATRLDGYTDAFDTVIDSGMYHCLDDDGKCSYLSALRRATRAGARLLLSCFSDAQPEDFDFPRPVVSEQTLRDTTGDTGWQITSLTPVTVQRGDLPAMAFWLVQAERR
ncbi:MAG: methyltransferase domain-containing protein [Mycobacteriaceae bacterium]|nr:methyltransferase domain-containing protein [Mycobacteriaceae bacterium]